MYFAFSLKYNKFKGLCFSVGSIYYIALSTKDQRLMDKFYSKFLSKKILLICLAGAFLLLLLTMFRKEVSNDDSWFGEQSYWLAKEGVVKLKSLPLNFTWDSYFLVYHKLLIWTGAAIVYCFGWSVNYFRFFNLLCFSTTLFFVFRYLKRYEEAYEIKYLAIFLLVFTPLSISKAFEFRPEVPAMLLGFLSFYGISSYVDNHKMYKGPLAGMWSGLAFLMHLNASIFVVSGFLLLIFRKDFKGSFLFSLGAAPIIFLYFIPLLDPDNFGQWLYVIRHWPQHHFGESLERSFVSGLVLKIAGEHKRYFWGETTIVLSSLFFLSLILKGKYLFKRYKVLMTYTVIAIISLAILGSDKVPRYLMYVMPFMATVVAITFFAYKDSQYLAPRLVFILLLVLQLIFTLHRSYGILSRHKPLVSHNMRIASYLPKGADVLAPWPFIYNEINNYQIDNFDTYLYWGEQRGRDVEQAELFKKAYQIGTEYIIIDAYTAKKYDYWFKGWNISDNPYFSRIVDKNGLVILKRNSAKPE